MKMFEAFFFFSFVLLYEPVLALTVVVQLALNHVDHDLITNQATLIHDLLGLFAQLSLLGDLRPQHISGSLLSKYKSQSLSIDTSNQSISQLLTKWHTQYLSLSAGAWVPLPSLRAGQNPKAF